MSNLPSFTLPTVFDNPKGWGPANTQLPKEFKDIPYIPFSKGDKVNRVANWISQPDPRDQRDQRNRGRHGRDMVQQTYGSNSASAFVFQAEADEESFSLVDNRGTAVKKIAVRAIHGGRGDARGGGARGRGGRGGMQRLGHGGFRGGRGGNAGGYRKRYNARERTHRFASVKPTEEWTLVQDIEFSRMKDLSFSVREPRDIGFYGKVGVYDSAYDRVNTRLERPLKAVGSARYNATASEDPVLTKLSEQDADIKVFATDSVIATLMASMVSMSAWDVVVNRVGDKLFFDKRDGGPMDFPSVNENAQDPPPEAGDKDASINSASMLAVEARDISGNLIKQVTGLNIVEYENANPFNEENDDGETPDDNAYRYRLFDLSAGATNEDDDEDSEEAQKRAAAESGPRCLMAIRTEVDGVAISGQTKKQMLIRALTQHDITAPGAGKALDWRQKLDSQRGAVVATEMQNNATKLARWAFQAILAGAEQLKVGFVSRVSPRERTRHGVLGFQTYRPAEFISQLGFNEYTGWGIVKAVVDMCLALPEGRYVIVRDPNKPLILVYAVPAGTFDDNGEDDASAAPAPAADDDASAF